MGYTWADAMLAIDVHSEETAVGRQQAEIEDAWERQNKNKALYSLGFSIIGSFFGPAGYLIGKKMGEWGADYFSTKDGLSFSGEHVEKMRIDIGKFNKAELQEINAELEKMGVEDTEAAIVNLGKDIAFAAVSAGFSDKMKVGKELSTEYEASKIATETAAKSGKVYPGTDAVRTLEDIEIARQANTLDLSTFGHGENAWTMKELWQEGQGIGKLFNVAGGLNSVMTSDAASGAIIDAGINVINPNTQTQCPPGLVWNEVTQNCDKA